MNLKRKKGFTIVELVIVIAIIGILSAILIPTFIGLVNSAREAADTHMVKNLNTALETDAITNGKHETAFDAIQAANKSGYSVEKLTPTSLGYDVVWDKPNDRFILIDDKGDYKFFDQATEPSENESDLWKIYSEIPTGAEYEKGYSIYLAGNAEIESMEITRNFDAGENTIGTISYKPETPIDNHIIVRSNNGGTLEVDNSLGAVSHYGILDNLNVISVAGKSYHEYGSVRGQLTVNDGHVVAENNAEINKLVVKVETGKVEISLESGAEVSALVVESATADNFSMTVSSANQVGCITGATDEIKANITDSNNQKVNIHEHKIVEAHEAIEVSCTENGQNAYYTCDCGKYFSDVELTEEIEENSWVIEKTGHILVVDEAVTPTCSQTGLTAGTHCSVCGEHVISQEIVDKIKHTLDINGNCIVCGHEVTLINKQDGTYSGEETTYLKVNDKYVGVDKVTTGLYKDDAEKLYVVTADVNNLQQAIKDGSTVIVSDSLTYEPGDNAQIINAAANVDFGGNKLTIISPDGKSGIMGEKGKTTTLSNGIIETNKTYGSSYPLITATKGTVELNAMTVSSTSSGYVVSAGSDGGKLIIKNSNITSIGTSRYAAAVFVGSQASTEIENSTIKGWINVSNNGTAILTNCSVEGHLYFDGGKIYINGGDYTNTLFDKKGVIAISGTFTSAQMSMVTVAQNCTKIDNGDGTFTISINAGYEMNYVYRTNGVVERVDIVEA